ncbi:MAG TPA: hypothetical protein VFY17_10610 [Pilimelia sp.]|nr:hypothetical protein [Pilimelia sp.]
MLLAGVVCGVLALAAFDGMFAVAGWGGFGETNGWLAVILPLMVAVEEFRAWSGWGRVLAAVGALAVAVAVGLLAAGLVDGPPLFGGAVGAVVTTALYAPLWFHGVRAATREEVKR